MIPVVFSTDHNFVMPTGVALNSMLRHSKKSNFDVFILVADSVTKKDKSILKDIVLKYGATITFISMGETFKNGFEIRNISSAAYYRLLIPWLIPQYDKIIYLDGDIVVCDDISPIYQIDLSDNYYAAVQPHRLDKNAFASHAPKMGVIPDNYVQSGVLLINAAKQRTDNLDSVFRAHVGKKYIFLDQDIISIVCGTHIAHLECRFNITPDLYSLSIAEDIHDSELLDARNHPCIIHYAGMKPWNQFTQAWNYWWQEYKISSFYEKNKEVDILNKTYSSDYSNKTLLALFARKNFPWIYKFRT